MLPRTVNLNIGQILFMGVLFTIYTFLSMKLDQGTTFCLYQFISRTRANLLFMTKGHVGCGNINIISCEQFGRRPRGPDRLHSLVTGLQDHSRATY